MVSMTRKSGIHPFQDFIFLLTKQQNQILQQTPGTNTYATLYVPAQANFIYILADAVGDCNAYIGNDATTIQVFTHRRQKQEEGRRHMYRGIFLPQNAR